MRYGLSGPYFHGLRTQATCSPPESSAGLKNLIAHMGHDTVRATMIYQHAANKAINRSDRQAHQRDPGRGRRLSRDLGSRGLVARQIDKTREMIKAETRNPPRTWAFFVGAGDANRTRAVQLGNCNDWPLVTSGAQVTALVDESVRDRD